jgi:hypothetical protein
MDYLQKAQQEFAQQLDEITSQEKPAHYNNIRGEIILYAKLLEIQKELNELKETNAKNAR